VRRRARRGSRRRTPQLNPRTSRSKPWPGALFEDDGRTMIRFLFRFIGLLCLALGFIFLVYDGTKSIADQKWLYVTRVSDVWATVHEQSLALVQPTLQRIAVWLWDPIAVNVLNAPSWLVLVVLATLLILIGRKRRPLIGYARD
jgi:hypothetical protein